MLSSIPPSVTRSLIVREALLLAPMVGAQVAICLTLLRRTRGRTWPHRGALVFTVLDTILTVSSILENSWLFGFEPDSLLWFLVNIVSGPGFVWLFSSTPAYAIYLVLKWLGAWKLRGGAPAAPARREFLTTATQLAAGAAIATPFAAMAYGIIVGRLDFEVREVDLPIKNLHPDLHGLRILQLSDIHLGSNLSEKSLAWVIDASNNLRPQIALMTGDLITSQGDPMETCIRQLARLKSDAGTFGCLGNHELYTSSEAFAKKESSRYGIDFLRMEARQLRFGNATLNFGGVDYQRSSTKHYLVGAERLLAPGAANILLSHNPDTFPAAAKQGWDAMLAGHTHGGQVTVEIVEQTLNFARFYTPYVAGLYRKDGSSCYVNRGIGTIGIPARVGVRPEITLLRLRKA